MLNGKKCFYCGRSLQVMRKTRVPKKLPVDAFTIDHIIPKSRLVGFRLNAYFHDVNMVECCHGCNNRKGNMNPFEWADLVGGDTRERLTLRLSKLPVDVLTLIR